MVLILGYWDIRGLAHAIRLLLEYTDSHYEEKKYTMGDAPDYDRSQWLNEKFKLGLDFPNLPYLIDGAHKVTQSNAILRYIARKHNLCGETEEEKIRVDILENQAMDTSNELARVCYSPDFVSPLPADGMDRFWTGHWSLVSPLLCIYLPFGPSGDADPPTLYCHQSENAWGENSASVPTNLKSELACTYWSPSLLSITTLLEIQFLDSVFALFAQHGLPDTPRPKHICPAECTGPTQGFVPPPSSPFLKFYIFPDTTQVTNPICALLGRT
ncbi:glutathione S-transferase alpha I isoform X1 [Ailuropoda melanoleuca]|nr:glutathione S-transferase alpha I isoform X1 [Ailuropoda melanoleuca]